MVVAILGDLCENPPPRAQPAAVVEIGGPIRRPPQAVAAVVVVEATTLTTTICPVTTEASERDARRLARADGPWRAKCKANEELKFPGLSDQAGFRAWKNAVYAKVNQASGRPDDKVLCWICRVEDRRYPDEFFEQVPMIFMGLSRKSIVAIQALVRGVLGTKISLIIDSYMTKVPEYAWIAAITTHPQGVRDAPREGHKFSDY